MLSSIDDGLLIYKFGPRSTFWSVRAFASIEPLAKGINIGLCVYHIIYIYVQQRL